MPHLHPTHWLISTQVTDIDFMFHKAWTFDQDLGWCVDYGVSIEGAFENSGCESTSCGVTHGICWGRGTNRRGVGLVLEARLVYLQPTYVA